MSYRAAVFALPRDAFATADGLAVEVAAALSSDFGIAVEAEAGFEDVRPAWSELVRRMDSDETTRTLGAGSLLWIGRVASHQIGGNPLADVGDFVHRSFVDAAAEEAK